MHNPHLLTVIIIIIIIIIEGETRGALMHVLLLFLSLLTSERKEGNDVLIEIQEAQEQRDEERKKE